MMFFFLYFFFKRSILSFRNILVSQFLPWWHLNAEGPSPSGQTYFRMKNTSRYLTWTENYVILWIMVNFPTGTVKIKITFNVSPHVGHFADFWVASGSSYKKRSWSWAHGIRCSPLSHRRRGIFTSQRWQVNWWGPQKQARKIARIIQKPQTAVKTITQWLISILKSLQGANGPPSKTHYIWRLCLNQSWLIH